MGFNEISWDFNGLIDGDGASTHEDPLRGKPGVCAQI